MNHSHLTKNLSLLILSLVSSTVAAEDCTSAPINPKGDTSKLQAALQQATNTGTELVLTGTYYISQDTKVYLRNDLKVDASEASFIATKQLDGDMFSFDTHTSKSDECGGASVLANFDWTGGTFNMSKAKVSTVVPLRYKTPAGREGTKQTADALSIRGATNSGRSKLNELLIEDIVFIGTENDTDPYYLAGGDSGILMTGALKAIIRNSSFFGVRDAAIYVSAGGVSGEYGDHFTLVNNYVERAYDGITSKRGADNIKMQNNIMNDVVVGLSIKRVYDGWTATNIHISENSVSNSVRPISVERANDVVIDSNRIDNLGSIVADSPKPTNKYGQQYEGIALNGAQGSNRVTNNIINGITQDDSREKDTTTWGIVLRPEDGRETTNVVIEDNSYSRLDKWVNRISL
ncbi:hypothetical protein ACFFUO_07085 [Vibrio artabrorum]|uniref:Right-handed parallel beta-helix repeat-containing protein n=1 Tax=Vibrio artabrorum TaxID=446374 RepID=A0ABT8CLI2_9VIBR|nr:right-handed parallel beta-helix repeat-containing protein [Vibrio artabrorum]MDN3702303.1 right-handed parallel beta-helix repeat-containing protein [Vibrio artabrorum]